MRLQHCPRYSPLVHRLTSTPDRTALIDASSGTEWTFGDLAKEAERIATTLESALSELDGKTAGRPGSREGDTRPRVGYLFAPCPEFVATLYGLWHCGWTAVGLHTALSPSELRTHAETADLDALVYSQGFESLAERVECPTVSAAPLKRADDSSDNQQPDDLAAARHPPEPATWDVDETALILFTSGTTGEPKAVRLTFGNLTASATASAFRLGVDPADRWLCCLPISHMGGFAPAVRTVLYGTCLVVQREFEPTETATVLDEQRITEVSLVPTQLKRLLDAEWTPSNSLETVLLGGAPATAELLGRAEAAGVPVYPTYGMTETASQIATARPGERTDHPDTVGQPLLCTEVTILDDGKAVDAGEKGEIVVAGPNVTPGYLDETHTEDAFGEHGFHTGDVGYQDQQGRLWVVGRRDDVIITGGELVSPGEVVETLRSFETVADGAVVGVPDEEWGERVAALVVPSDGSELRAETVRERCRERLAAYKLPKDIETIEELPRTGSDTVDREAVREVFEE